jgi:sugar phosphate isomerase/epimerase
MEGKLMSRQGLTRRDFLCRSAAGIAGFTLAGFAHSSQELSTRVNPIIYFTKFLRGLGPEEIAGIVKKLNLDGLDLAVRGGQCVNPDNVREELPRAMKIWKKAGLSVPLVSTETSLTDPRDPTVQPIWAACAEAGVENIKVGYWRWREGESYSKTLDQARRDLEGFQKLSAKHGVRTLVHTHSGFYLGCNASSAMALLRDFDPRYVAVYLDPAHVAVNGEPLELALAIIGDNLAMVAAKNVAYVPTRESSSTKWDRKWCLLRDGLVDWPRAVALLRKRGYKGPLSLHGEYTGPEDLDAILRNVEQDAKYLVSIVR